MPVDSFALEGCDASVLQKGHGNIGRGEGSRQSQKKTNEWEITHFREQIKEYDLLNLAKSW